MVGVVIEVAEIGDPLVRIIVVVGAVVAPAAVTGRGRLGTEIHDHVAVAALVLVLRRSR